MILSPSLELISPELSLDELRKYSKELINKSKIRENDLDALFSELKKHITFITLEQYENELKNALKIGEKFSEKQFEEFIDDIDFFALALKEKTPIWSNDKLFKEQTAIKVFNTKELDEYLKSLRE